MTLTEMEAAPVIAVDGPSGAGKGTLCERLAGSLGWHLLDSGALYRVLGLAALDAEQALDDPQGLARLATHLDVHFLAGGESGVRVVLSGQEVTARLRTEQAAAAASRVAALTEVREALLERQRAFAREPGLIADGRDMGTVVFPDAALKVYLTASPEERARRRHKQLMNKGQSASLEIIEKDIRARDERDMNRAVAPLKPAEDALVLDSTELTLDQVERAVLDLARDRGLVEG